MGDIEISTRGTANDRKLVLFHEKVHRFLVPKLYVLRNFRVLNRAQSYVRSSLWRYLEEMLSETVAQVGVHGFREFLTGVKFPVQKGYVYLTRGGGYMPYMRGKGVLTEAAALLGMGSIMGVSFNLWLVPTSAEEK